MHKSKFTLHQPKRSFPGLLLCLASLALGAPAWALTGVQTGPSGATYASAGIQCAVNPTTGLAPMVHAGLYSPKKNTSGTLSLNDAPVATVTFVSPDAMVWLANGYNTVAVTVNRKMVPSFRLALNQHSAESVKLNPICRTKSGHLAAYYEAKRFSRTKVRRLEFGR